MDNKIVLIFVLLVLSVQGIGGTPHDKSKGCPNCRILPNEDDPVKRSSQACFCEAIRKVLEIHCGDECSSSPCKNNGVCKNLVGGFECSCSAGYEGPRCEKDIDECAHGSHDCLPNLATCINTAGSYNCVCNNGYVGDGKKSCQPEECQIYQSLSSADRKVTSGIGNNTCDSGLGPGWFRFEGSAGSRMPTSCPPRSRCGAYGPGWMNGKHPTVDDGKVSRKVCFNWMSCCRFSTNVQVRNCGSYYVYHLGHTPTCNLRYCGTD